ncbi:hypothetical protein GYMLUDRAFT_56425 [Collybiopsis luxurians FD-317 M1]|nr:hypothetical protein GYMLUDRAFT_56425 [Collybiopsis luxurians FD-317 M1]
MSSSNTSGDTANANAASTTVQGTATQQTIASAQTLAAVAQTTQPKVDAAAQATQSDADAQTTQSDAVVLKSLAVTLSTDDSSADAKTQATTSSSSSDSASPTTAKASSTSDAKTTATTNASTTSSSAKATSVSSSATNSSSSSSSASSTSASTSSDSSSSTSAQATQTSAPSGSPSMTASIMTSTINGQPTTITTDVLAITSSTQDPQPTNLSNLSKTGSSFFENKAAVGGTFGAVGLVSLFLLLAIVLKIVRYRARRKFEKDLDEQVERETRAGTPFGFGKEDDDILPPGLSDPEKAYGGPYANQAGPGYAMGNTAAYATYGSAAAMQPAYYSPNSGGAMPRRYSPPQFGNGYNTGNGLSRPPSGGSAKSYGTLNQAPMNAFAPAPAGPTGPAPTFAPPTFAGNYGEYRGAHSPAPSSNSNTSSTIAYLARPGTPSSLTPGGGTGPAPAALSRPYAALGTRPDSPAILARYGRSSGGSEDSGTYGAEAYSTTASIKRERSLAQTGLAVPDNGNVEPSSLHLPNPFDQRD